ncbi:ComEC/Rec2 family competence protein [Desulforamulus aeronauticus]|uniref:Metallo-beta-lactamase superfamily protein n=1 Tax=Desulforamulus aeronauticus DSM 10349 TaxID=1121421 RepID=A0A1M6UYV5_9FIRM|nr:MBL fold metallo-hydrolase [Desulforamulus aeronauticus]SHK74275.1 Metallo-beta-lactamase superfamily protein [Desulforamulus aeronauticus DSM 10349]
MSNCVVHFLPAKAGDCFVVEFNNGECILIDCGYKDTYEIELKPLLIQLKHKGCRVILMLITHIDQDHIGGAIAFLSENGPANAPHIIEVENIWFNGFFNTLFMRDEFNERKRAAIGEMQTKRMNMVLGQLTMQIDGKAGLISAAHSRSFEELCAKNGYRLNAQFIDRVVKRIADSRNKLVDHSIQIGECKLIVLSPNEASLDRLAHKLNIEMIRNFGVDYELSEHMEFAALFERLMELQLEPGSFEEYISASEPRLERWIGTSTLAHMNEVNNASIVIEIEYKGLILLFTGDSDSDSWAEFLTDEYDMIKISHHGTTKPNLKLLEKAKGRTLLISTNGGKQNRHPENELLARAILTGNKIIYFNYDIKQKQELIDMQEEYGYSAMFGHREIRL